MRISARNIAVPRRKRLSFEADDPHGLSAAALALELIVGNPGRHWDALFEDAHRRTGKRAEDPNRPLARRSIALLGADKHTLGDVTLAMTVRFPAEALQGGDRGGVGGLVHDELRSIFSPPRVEALLSSQTEGTGWSRSSSQERSTPGGAASSAR